MIVSDAGPLIIFARLGRLSLLRDVTGHLTIPLAVNAEIMVNQGTMPGAAEIAQADWIVRETIADQSLLPLLAGSLHEGEREAIALAAERNAQLLMDEIRGRRVATQLGIEVIGSLRILAEAKRIGIIESVGPLLKEMRSNGYRIDHDLMRRFLDAMNEA
jgi:predicted nucleic acid-binding protein